MKRWLILLGTVLVLTTGLLLFNDRAKTAEPSKPAQWEYKVVRFTDVAMLGGEKDVDKQTAEHAGKGLNKLAEEGWELVAVTAYGNSAGDRHLYLKRPKSR